MSTHKEKLEHLLNGGSLKSLAGSKRLNKDGYMEWTNGLETNIIYLDMDALKINHDKGPPRNN